VPCLWFELFSFLHFPGTATCRVFFYRLRVGYPDPWFNGQSRCDLRGRYASLGGWWARWLAQSSMQFAQQVRDPLEARFGNLGVASCGHSCLISLMITRLRADCRVALRRSTGHLSTRERQIPDTTPETVLSHKRGAARAPLPNAAGRHPSPVVALRRSRALTAVGAQGVGVEHRAISDAGSTALLVFHCARCSHTTTKEQRASSGLHHCADLLPRNKAPELRRDCPRGVSTTLSARWIFNTTQSPTTTSSTQWTH
jgi:hypothetical protein